jgi:hypothetical protein
MDQTLHVGNDGMRDLLVDTQSRRIPSRIDTRSTPDPSRIVAGIAIIFAAYSVMMTPVRDTQLVITHGTAEYFRNGSRRESDGLMTRVQ